ncbi:hypothetical protein B0H13DRAFT_1888765 [Mycena leptocephala]|nr:hypothetical protein B0H13DRAFT_1888765 [Mycena leptocephala]
MTDHSHPTPAASPTAAGAGSLGATSPAVNVALSAFSTTMDALIGHVAAISSAPVCQMANTVGSIIAAADAVQQAHQNLVAAVLAVATLVPAPPSNAHVGAANSGSGPGSFLRTTGPWIAGALYSVVPQAPLAAVPDNGDKWFSITRGKYVGLTKNAAISLKAVTGVSTGLSEKHNSQADALDNFNSALATDAVAVFA